MTSITETSTTTSDSVFRQKNENQKYLDTLRLKTRIIKRLLDEISFRSKEVETLKCSYNDVKDEDVSEKKRIKDLLDESTATLAATQKSIRQSCMNADTFALNSFPGTHYDFLSVCDKKFDTSFGEQVVAAFDQLIEFFSRVIEFQPDIINELSLWSLVKKDFDEAITESQI